MTKNKFYIPTEYEIRGMKIGSLAPDCMGKMKPIVEITAKEQDVNDKWFIYYYVPFGTDGSKISHSLTEDKLDRSLPLCKLFDSHELDIIEREMLGKSPF